MSFLLRAAGLAALCLSAEPSFSAEPPRPKDRASVEAQTLVPYNGPSEHGVDTSTLTSKVMCGYQGWFNCEGDGASRGWVHWTKRNNAPMGPGNVKVDLWPDTSELSAEEKFPSGLTYPDGRAAEVFSSYTKATVLRHFEWMKSYGIDGAWVQRFAVGVSDPSSLWQNNVVLSHCREGANRSGRTYAVMYDLSGMGEGKMDRVMEDWRNLRLRMHIADDPAYLHHKGKPVVSVWGIGFNDRRKYTLADCRKLIEFLKNDPEAGGCTVMLGVPTYWREQTRDTVPDADLHDILALADIISPWTVGRYGKPADAERHAEKVAKPDAAWCQEHKLEYLPVAFPGFSWHNMYGAKLESIPRAHGEFFWSQVRAYKKAGAGMLYVAMFDEVDEGTAVFKCTNQPPASAEIPFATFEGLPSDYYLRLVGLAGKIYRGEVPVETPLPPAEAK